MWSPTAAMTRLACATLAIGAWGCESARPTDASCSKRAGWRRNFTSSSRRRPKRPIARSWPTPTRRRPPRPTRRGAPGSRSSGMSRRSRRSSNLLGFSDDKRSLDAFTDALRRNTGGSTTRSCRSRSRTPTSRRSGCRSARRRKPPKRSAPRSTARRAAGRVVLRRGDREPGACRAARNSGPAGAAHRRVGRCRDDEDREAHEGAGARRARAGDRRARKRPAAAAALDRFMGINDEIVALSRRNSNVRSLALSLGRKRMVTAECEDDLRALEDALAKHEFSATR